MEPDDVEFDISNLDNLMQHNSSFEISEVYHIGLQRYRY